MVWGIEGSGSNDAIVTKTLEMQEANNIGCFSVPTQQEVGPTGPLFLKKALIKYTLLIKGIVETNPQITAGIQIDNANAVMVTGLLI